MDADWYEDPLGRYDGRFFDGENWTAQVSAGGSPAVDPDFPPVAAAEFDSESPAAAVQTIDRAPPRRASTLAESPARTVAVLDETLVARRPEAGSSRMWRWFALAAVAALAAFLIFLVSRDGDTAPSEFAEERVEDLERGGTVDDEVAAEADSLDPAERAEIELDPRAYDRSEAVQVGSQLIVNGESALQMLHAWHVVDAADRGVELAAGAGCWFGQLGDSLVQTAQCGPLETDVDGELVFDIVPLLFARSELGMIAQPLTADLTPNAVLPNTLTLVGHPDTAPPPRS